MINAYKKYWKQYADFTGRSTRSDYWWVVLCNLLIMLPVSIFMVISISFQMVRLASETSYYGDSYAPTGEEIFNIFFSPVTIILLIILLLFQLATFVPGLAITVRRLRDGGFHWAFIFLQAPAFLSVIPFVTLIALPCQIALLVLTCMPTKQANPYALNQQQAYYQGQTPPPGQIPQANQFGQGPAFPNQQVNPYQQPTPQGDASQQAYQQPFQGAPGQQAPQAAAAYQQQVPQQPLQEQVPYQQAGPAPQASNQQGFEQTQAQPSPNADLQETVQESSVTFENIGAESSLPSAEEATDTAISED